MIYRVVYPDKRQYFLIDQNGKAVELGWNDELEEKYKDYRLKDANSNPEINTSDM